MTATNTANTQEAARRSDPPAEAGGGLYVYCIAPGQPGRTLGPIGLDGQVVYTVASGPVCAVVHDCEPRPYESQDPQVVRQWVIAHQRVVQQAMDTFRAVLPMAFDVVVGNDRTAPAEALRAWLDEKRERFVRLLGRLADKAEYGVQVFCDRQAIAASLIDADENLRALRDEARDKPKGLAHVLQQKLARAVRGAFERRADELAADFYQRVRRSVDDVRVEKLKTDDAGRQMLLNLSCLMTRGAETLGRQLDAIRSVEGIRVRFTGPWPPYSFVGA